MVFNAEKCANTDELALYILQNMKQLVAFDNAVLIFLSSGGEYQQCYQFGANRPVPCTLSHFQRQLVQQISTEYRHCHPRIEECVLDSQRVTKPRLRKTMKDLKINQAFGLGLWDTDDRLRCIFSLERHTLLSFSHQDKQVVDIVFHHLNTIYQGLMSRGDQQTDWHDTRLTRREHEVGDLLMRGLTNEQIADKLSISPATVAKHIANMHHKLGVQSQSELLAELFNNQHND